MSLRDSRGVDIRVSTSVDYDIQVYKEIVTCSFEPMPLKWWEKLLVIPAIGRLYIEFWLGLFWTQHAPRERTVYPLKVWIHLDYKEIVAAPEPQDILIRQWTAVDFAKPQHVSVMTEARVLAPREHKVVVLKDTGEKELMSEHFTESRSGPFVYRTRGYVVDALKVRHALQKALPAGVRAEDVLVKFLADRPVDLLLRS